MGATKTLNYIRLTSYCLDEKMLVSYLRQQKPFAFDYLYNNYSAALYTVIFTIVNDEYFANDVLQECFIKIWINFKDYDAHKSKLFTWMHSIARNCAIDLIRSKRYKQSKHNINIDEISNLNKKQNCINIQTIGIHKLVNKLQSNLKEIIGLSYFSGYTDEEISIHLNIPSGTVKTRKRNALVFLRKIMKDN